MVKRINMVYQNHSKQSTTSNTGSSYIPDPVEMNPFSSNQSFVLYLEPIYNPVLQIYQNVITLNCVPAGPVSNMVSHINLPKLSPFQQATPNYDGSNCVFVLLRHPVSKIGSGNSAFKWNGAFMGSDDIPSVFSYLQTHGYPNTDILVCVTRVLEDLKRSGRLVGFISTSWYLSASMAPSDGPKP